MFWTCEEEGLDKGCLRLTSQAGEKDKGGHAECLTQDDVQDRVRRRHMFCCCWGTVKKEGFVDATLKSINLSGVYFQFTNNSFCL